MERSTISKRLLSGIGLAVVSGMLLASATGCQKSNTAAKTKTSTENATKPTTITAILDSDMLMPTADGQSAILDEFKKETGITLSVIAPSHNQYTEKLNLQFASGDVPDVVEVTGNNYVQYATNGALYDMTSLINGSSVYKTMDQSQINAIKVKNKLYAIPWAKGSGTVTYIRQDWLDKLGLKVPTTYDEFTNMLKAFVNNDPDGDGKADTIGLTAAGLIYGDSKQPSDATMYLPEFYQGASPDFEVKNGKWVDGFTQSDTIEAFKRLQSAYKEGLIDKEIVTNTTSTCRDKWNAGKVGVFNYWAGTWVANSEDAVKKSVPSAKLTVINPIKGATYLQRGPLTLAMSSKCKNPSGVFKYFFEYVHDGKVDGGTMLFAHGVKGFHYSVDSNGNYSPLPSKSNPATKYYKTTVEPGANLESNFKDPITPDSRISSSLTMFYKNSTLEKLFPSSPAYASKITDLTTARTSILSKIVVNGEDVNTAISDYKSQESGNVNAILKDFNAGGVAVTSSAASGTSSGSTSSK